MRNGTKTRARRATLLTLPLGLLGCGGAGDAQVLYEAWLPSPGPRQPAFLAFPPERDAAPSPADTGSTGFPRLLSETGVFIDLGELEPERGILPYEVQAPLWSDGAFKRRWMALPEGSIIQYSSAERWKFPPGTVFVKHFEMALDERRPAERRRLETRVWVAARADAQYGVTYRWNEEQTDAELLLQQETESLSITGQDGETRSQPYLYPGPSDCLTCHNARAGFVLGVRTAQLNRSAVYRRDRPAANQLTTWSEWDLFDTSLDTTATSLAPQLLPIADENADLEQRVRSYWDGNCAMCHAGTAGSVPGWDARFATPLEEQGLGAAPQAANSPASQLIMPGAPDQSLISLRGDTTELGVRMPPLGRNRVDRAYVDVLTRWINSLEQ